MKIEPLAVTFILSLVLPLVIGLVTKYSASAQVKQIVLLIATGAATLLNANLTDSGYAVLSWNTVALWGISLVATIATYLGIYKPHEVNQKLAPEVGFGGGGPLD